jgi:hypothetical protein
MANERGFVLVKDASNKTVASWVIKSDSRESDEILVLVTGEITDDLAGVQKSIGRGVTFTRTDTGSVSKGKATVPQKKTVDELVQVLKSNLPAIQDPSLKAAVGQTISQHELRKQAQDQFGGANDAWITETKGAQAGAVASATAPWAERAATGARNSLIDVRDGAAPPADIEWSPEADEQMRVQLHHTADPVKKEAIGYSLTLSRLRAHARAEQRGIGGR